MKKTVSYFLLILCWPITNIHRYWNDQPVNAGKWIVFEEYMKQPRDIQWYVKDTSDMLCVTMILLAFLLAIRDRVLKIIVRGFLIVSLLDIVHYWLYYKHNEYFLLAESVVLFASIIVAYLNRNK
jgi:hypothetical protein